MIDLKKQRLFHYNYYNIKDRVFEIFLEYGRIKHVL